MADLQTHQVDEEDRSLACAQAPEEIPASHPPVRKTNAYILSPASFIHSQTLLENRFPSITLGIDSHMMFTCTQTIIST